MRSKLLIIALALLVAGFATAQERITTPPPVDPAQTPAPAAKMSDDAAATTIEILPADAAAATSNTLRPAMIEELRLVREQETAAVAELVADLAGASSDERVELQKRIGEIKSGAMLQSLTIQMEYATLGGHEELAQRLETDIEQFEARLATPRGTINTDTVRERPASGGASR